MECGQTKKVNCCGTPKVGRRCQPEEPLLDRADGLDDLGHWPGLVVDAGIDDQPFGNNRKPIVNTSHVSTTFRTSSRSI
jgi:hypothetical protein